MFKAWKEKNWTVLITADLYLLSMVAMLYFTLTGQLGNFVTFEIPGWYNYFLYGAFIVYTVGMYYILQMKKIALKALTIITVLLYIDFMIFGLFSMSTFIMDIIVFGILWTQYKKMD